MTGSELRRSASADGLPPLLAALWWDAQGDWQRAHEIAQAVDTPEGAWVHAYLHRKEGDLENADYWYRRAGRQRPAAPLAAEWAELVEAMPA
jgi:hypothetical protein